MKKTSYLLIALLCAGFFPAQTQGGENEKSNSSFRTYLLPVIGFEAGAAFCSIWAAYSPKSLGVAFAVFAPIATHGTDGYRTTWPVLIGFESLAAYNLIIDEKSRTRRELFRENMIGWQLFALFTGSVALLQKSNSLAFAYIPAKRGGVFSVRYSF
ncbi:MAG TPA: hypothetical protein ENJ29_06420 [Bacteroidetes bacterium]|nr:hypothetical protein [Bacteroidota bacterium]